MKTYDVKLSAFLFNKTRRGLLGLLFSHPDESFYVNQILQLLNAGSGAVQRELKIMTEANSKNPVFNELKSIITKTFGGGWMLFESHCLL